MNIEEIEYIEAMAKREREQLEQKEILDYESAEHNVFEIGDWVTNGEIIGTVQRIIRSGWINVDIKNGSGGTLTSTMSNDFEYLDTETVDYYTTPQPLSLTLTGEDVEAFFRAGMSITNLNPSKLKDKLRAAMESIRIKS